MRYCPACTAQIDANDTQCPQCGITLHPGSSGGDPEGVGGPWSFALVVLGIGFLVTLVLCLGLLLIRREFWQIIRFIF